MTTPQIQMALSRKIASLLDLQIVLNEVGLEMERTCPNYGEPVFTSFRGYPAEPCAADAAWNDWYIPATYLDTLIYVRHRGQLPKVFNEDNFWRFREHCRFINGVYEPIKIFGHETNLTDIIGFNQYFLHASTTDGRLVAYTASPEQGKMDRQTRSKLGKYLKAMHSHCVPDPVIRELATQYGSEVNPYTLKYAENEAEIERVYQKCTTESCMSKTKGFWGLRRAEDNELVHPTAVYDSDDIGVAYVTDEADRVVARAIINIPENRYVRIYGHDEAMKHLLRTQGGITSQGSLAGVRLKRINLKDNFVACPFLDGTVYNFDVEEDTLYVRSGGSHSHPPYNIAKFLTPQACIECGTMRRASDMHTGSLLHDPTPNAPRCYTCYMALRATVQQSSQAALDALGVAEAGRNYIPQLNDITRTRYVHRQGYLAERGCTEFILDDSGRCYDPSLDWSNWLIAVDGYNIPRDRIANVMSYTAQGERQFRFERYINTTHVRVYPQSGEIRVLHYQRDQINEFPELVPIEKHRNGQAIKWGLKKDYVRAVYTRRGARKLTSIKEAVYDAHTDTWYKRTYMAKYFWYSSLLGPDPRNADRQISHLSPHLRTRQMWPPLDTPAFFVERPPLETIAA